MEEINKKKKNGDKTFNIVEWNRLGTRCPNEMKSLNR